MSEGAHALDAFARGQFAPVIERPLNGGIQKVYRFDNGYGASVIKNPYSYGGDKGLWELAVTKLRNGSPDAFDLTYSTPITDDVLGRLTWAQVEETLTKIAALAPASATASARSSADAPKGQG